MQRLINDHNAAVARGEPSSHGHLRIQQAVHFTAYLVDPSTVDSLTSLAQLPPDTPKEDVKYLANNIVITPRPASAGILRRVGGLGHKVTWRVAATATYENRVWAASVRPVPDTLSYHTESRVPLLVLAVRKGSRPVDANHIRHWQPLPPESAVTFDTVVGEKVLLEILDDQRQLAGGNFGLSAARPARRKRFPPESAPAGPLSLTLPQPQPLSLQLAPATAVAAQQALLPAPVASKRANLGPSQHHTSSAAAHPLQHQLPPKPAEAPHRSEPSASAAHRAYHGQQYYGRGKSGPGGYRGGRGGGTHRGSRGGDRGSGGGPYHKGRHRGGGGGGAGGGGGGVGGGGGGGGGGSGAASLASSAFDGAGDAPPSHHPPTAPRYNYGGSGGGSHANGSAAGDEGGVRIRYVANGGHPTG